jgi:dienelactone hydrolase
MDGRDRSGREFLRAFRADRGVASADGACAIARRAYLQAIAIDPSCAEPVALPFGDRTIRGYLRRPAEGRASARRAPLVVLLNGLDSVCEVEMHAFGAWFLTRGFVVLALDLPTDASSPRRVPLLEVERAAEAITSFAASLDGVQQGALAAFGVSFGGHLAARLLTARGAFRCGVAVSPPAWIARHELPARVDAMFAWAFAASNDAELDGLASRAQLDALPPPDGRLLLFHMNGDQLFGPKHARAFVRWGGDAVTLREVDAEHVGTSAFHQWLPFACDWLRAELA